MKRLRFGRTVACAAFCLALLPGAPLHAQRTPAEVAAHDKLMAELAKLREAAALEGAGNISAAEQVAREVLGANPESLTALLTLERLLGLQGRLPEIVKPMDRLLALQPSSVVAHQMRLRVLNELDDESRIESAIAAWIKATPSLEPPYREGAAVWRQRGEYARAIALLEQGRQKVDRADALALELGDAYAAAGDAKRAAVEWNRAIGAEGRGFLLVQRRLQSLSDGGARILPPLVDHLAGEPITVQRQRAAAVLAIEAGLADRAFRLAKDLAGIASPRDRETLLVEIARRADGAELHRVAAWAYGALLRDAKNPGAMLSIKSRIAELALLTGDTALAKATYRELELASAAGSPQRRQAIALRIQLTAREGNVATAVSELASFRAEYPKAPELGETAAAIATHMLAAGDLDGADRVLRDMPGADAALLRGRLYIRRGDVEQAQNELLSAAPLLHGREATETIALAALLLRLSPEGGELVARVTGAENADRAEMIHDIAAKAEALPTNERAAILDFLAATAERSGLHEDADALRREIVNDAPRSTEAPSAILALARRSLNTDPTADQARVLLEKLILEYPRSTLAPQARSELQRLQARSTVRSK